MKINWGTKIVIAYICFGIIIFSMVFISMKQDVSLVAKDYYKQEIAYGDQMNRISNFNSLDEPPSINFDRTSSRLTLEFPLALTVKINKGTIHLFRPSSADLDKKYNIKLNEKGDQTINLANLSNGLWKVKLNWTMDGDEYYHERTIVI